MAADTPDDLPSPTPPARPVLRTEREMREAEDLALAASGLGSGLLKRQLPEDDSVAVLKVCPHCGTEYETAARFCPADGTSLRPKGSDSLIGRVLAERYHILKRIGEGGMGRVYLGEHVKMNRQCAIKVMNPALVNDHESAMRFAREASSAARIIHPNVAAVFDFGESEGLVYLVMEYVEGEPLSRIIAREAPLSLDRAVELTRQIADGLGAAHELGIVHRDLKPDNILVARTRAGKEIAKVVDFGIAKAMQETVGEALTRTGLVIGTPEFMSPEQLLGDPIDARSDLYALGCILHLMLTAIPPFEAPTREQMIKRRLAEAPPHVKSLDPSLPESLDRIVERLLARDPANRYGSAAEVRDALNGSHRRPSGGHEGPRAAPLQMTPRSAPTVTINALENATTELSSIASLPAAPAALAVRAAAVRRQRSWLITAGGVLVAAFVFVALRMTSGAAPGPQDNHAVQPSGAVVGARPSPAAVDSAAKKAAAARRIASARATGATGPGTVAGTADSQRALAARLERKRVQDSVSRADRLIPHAIRATISDYARAIESRDVGQMRKAYPSMSGSQENDWKNIFSLADSIKASVRYSPISATPNSIVVPFILQLHMVKAKKVTVASLPSRAVFAKAGRTWQLQEIH